MYKLAKNQYKNSLNEKQLFEAKMQISISKNTKDYVNAIQDYFAIYSFILTAKILNSGLLIFSF